MKRLLLEGDCSVLERSLLASIDLDVPPPRALEKLRAALAREEGFGGRRAPRDEETALVPAVAAARQARATKLQQRAAIGAIFGLAAGFALFLIARHNRVETVQKDPSVPMMTNAPQVPVAPPPTESVLAPGILVTPPPVESAHAPPPAKSVRRPPRVAPSGPRPSADDLLGAALDGRPLPRSAPVPATRPSAEDILSAAMDGNRYQSFDKGAAAKYLISVDLYDCKQIPGPDGSGHVTVVFQPDGSVSSVVIDQGPFPGTPRGACIVGKYRSVMIPPFDGAHVRVGKSFVL